MFENTIKLDKILVPIGVVLAMSLFTANPIATFTALFFVPFAAKLLWRVGEPPVLFFGLMMQWLQVCSKILYADFRSLNFSEVFENYAHIHQAYYYSIISLYVICIGIFVVIQNLPKSNLDDFKEALASYDLKKIMALYIFAVFFSPVITGFSYVIPGMQQFFVKVQDLKWSILFVLFSFYFVFDKNKILLYTILVGEIIISLTGYFSSFKDFVLIGITIYLFVKKSYSVLNYAVFTGIAVLLFNFMIVWQYVKPQYRAYLSEGEAAQVVTVSKNNALGKFYDLVTDTDDLNYQDGIETLLDRLAYIDIFSATIDYVPLQVPHENGKLWFDAVKRVFMPRILFPDKTAINDSDKTNLYSGLTFAGVSTGTSVSLGYVTESYIDFGFPGMLVPLFAWGLLIGLIYKHIITKSYNLIWGLALVLPFLFQLNAFEVALDKIVGSMVSFFLIYFLMNKFVIKHIDKYLKI